MRSMIRAGHGMSSQGGLTMSSGPTRRTSRPRNRIWHPPRPSRSSTTGCPTVRQDEYVVVASPEDIDRQVVDASRRPAAVGQEPKTRHAAGEQSSHGIDDPPGEWAHAPHTRPGGHRDDSVQVSLPVSWHAAARSRYGLVQRVMLGRGQVRTGEVLLGPEVPEPVLARLVAPDDRVPRVGRVVTGMLRWRRVAAADVAAGRAPAEVQPPPSGGETLDASCAARRYRRINVHFVPHPSSPTAAFGDNLANTRATSTAGSGRTINSSG
jgi:hypothetical protein